MSRRWLAPLLAMAVASGTMIATAGAASAATVPHATYPSVHGFNPGGTLALHGLKPGLNHIDAQVGSSNWSGYAVTGSNGTFKSVTANWTEPTGKCTSGQTTYSSFWVGLDGYSSDSVEQTGSEVDCNGRTPSYYSWYEMYPAYPVNFAKTVKAGDSFTGTVTFSGTNTYTLKLSDNTQGWTKTITKKQSGLDRSSAEVITEAPSDSAGPLPLTDFGTVNYSSSAVNGTSLGTQNPQGIYITGEDTTSSINSSGGFSNTWTSSG
jgi:Peptidase A4 family